MARALTNVLKRHGLLLGVALIALGVRLYCYVGIGVEDDPGFVGCGWDLSRGMLPALSDQALRRGTYMFAALLYYLTGNTSDLATQLPHLIMGVSTVVMSAAIGKRLFGPVAGLFSGLFLAFLPLHVGYSTRTMPEVPESFWGTCALAILVCCVDGEGRRRRGAAVAAGVCCGMGYLARETASVVLLAVAGAFVLDMVFDRTVRKARLCELLGAVGGFLIVFGAETALNYKLSGDLLYRWHVVKRSQSLFYGVVDADFYLFYVKTLLHAFPTSTNDYWAPPSGFQGWFILLAAPIFTIAGARGKARYVAVWFWTYVLFLSVGSTSFSSYYPIRRFPRYMIMFFPAASIMCGWLLGELWKLRAGRFRIGIVFCVGLSAMMLSYSGGVAYEHHRFSRSIDATERLVDRELDAYPWRETFLWFEAWQSVTRLRWNSYKAWTNVGVIHGMDIRNHPEGYVVVGQEIRTGKWCLRYCAPALFDEIPPDWVLLKVVEPVDGVYFRPGLRPVIFYAPPSGTCASTVGAVS